MFLIAGASKQEQRLANSHPLSDQVRLCDSVCYTATLNYSLGESQHGVDSGLHPKMFAPAQIAFHLTQIEFQMFSEIPQREYLHNAWSKKGGEGTNVSWPPMTCALLLSHHHDRNSKETWQVDRTI